VTSAVTGQRSNQLSYTPARGKMKLQITPTLSQREIFRVLKKVIRATDAKEVGMENPAEETCCHPNQNRQRTRKRSCRWQGLSRGTIVFDVQKPVYRPG
ncbi:MAG: hypothetical protein NTW03_10495, partial [Verrucomicrobia bacterium]|nr:hypothetical protein [Verrucomicrobiota bacterium]